MERQMMDLGVERLVVPTHYVREQYIFTDDPGLPDIVTPASNVDEDDVWMPIPSRSPQEYTDAIALVLELYYEDIDQIHRVWIETRCR